MATEPTHIRPYRLDDAEQLYDAIEETRSLLSIWMPWCTPSYTLETTKSWLASIDSAQPGEKEYRFAVVDGSDRHLGGVGLGQINHGHRFANLGYWVSTSASGRGVATAAVRQVSEFAFANTELVRLELVIALENEASLRVAEKAGALREGVLFDRLSVHGKTFDAAMYSIVRSRFDVQ